MRLAVLACPRCRRVQTVELRHARVACRGCRDPIVVASRKAYWQGDDDQEALRAVQRISAQLAGMSVEDYAQLLMAHQADTRGTVEDVIASLAARGEFTSDEFAEELVRLRVRGTPERHLAALQLDQRIYEPRPGRFRTL